MRPRVGDVVGRRIRRTVASLPGAVVLVRILKNAYWGLRRRVLSDDCTIDGVTHKTMSPEESAAYVRGVFEDYLRQGGIGTDALRSYDILEIGPGDSLGVALLLMGAGARSVVCIDRFRTHREPEREIRLLRSLTESSPEEMRARMVPCLLPGGGLASDAVQYLPGIPIERATEVVGSERFDLIVSRSVLEHVYDLDATYAECRRLLRHGGRMIHKVDLSNHSDVERHPLQFLAYPDVLWRLMSSNISRINRCRWPDHRAALERGRFLVEGFVPTRIYPLETVRSIRSRLAPRFRDMTDEDLAVGGFFVRCRAV